MCDFGYAFIGFYLGFMQCLGLVALIALFFMIAIFLHHLHSSDDTEE